MEAFLYWLTETDLGFKCVSSEIRIMFMLFIIVSLAPSTLSS